MKDEKTTPLRQRMIEDMHILQRQSPTASPAVVFTETELRLLEQTMPSSRKSAPRDLKFFVTAVARLGGYLDRSQDAPPGTTVI